MKRAKRHYEEMLARFDKRDDKLHYELEEHKAIIEQALQAILNGRARHISLAVDDDNWYS